MISYSPSLTSSSILIYPLGIRWGGIKVSFGNKVEGTVGIFYNGVM